MNTPPTHKKTIAILFCFALFLSSCFVASKEQHIKNYLEDYFKIPPSLFIFLNNPVWFLLRFFWTMLFLRQHHWCCEEKGQNHVWGHVWGCNITFFGSLFIIAWSYRFWGGVFLDQITLIFKMPCQNQYFSTFSNATKLIFIIWSPPLWLLSGPHWCKNCQGGPGNNYWILKGQQGPFHNKCAATPIYIVCCNIATWTKRVGQITTFETDMWTR